MLLVAVRLGLWIAPFASLRRWTARLARPRDTSPGAAPLPAERIVWAVSAVGRRVPGGQNCLARALTTQTLLARYGHPARLRIGVAHTTERGFHAHAWVETRDGVVLRESTLARFTAPPVLDREQLRAPRT